MYDLSRVQHYNDEVVKILQGVVGIPGADTERVANQVYEILMEKWTDLPEPLLSTPTRDFEIVGVLNFVRRSELTWEEKIQKIVGTAEKNFSDGIMAQALKYYDYLSHYNETI